MNADDTLTLNDRLINQIHENRSSFRYAGITSGPEGRAGNLLVVRVTTPPRGERPTFLAYERTGRVK